MILIVLFTALVLGAGYLKLANFGTSEGKVKLGANFGDKRVLVGWADDVFIGHVRAVVDHIERDGLPYTLFSVEVQEVIKGQVGGLVLVLQAGGTDPRSGQLYIEDSDPLLVVGERYVLSTRLHSNREWNTVASRGSFLIESSDHYERLSQEFRDAYRNEIPDTVPNPATADRTPPAHR